MCKSRGRQDPYSKSASNSKKLKRIWLVVSKGWPRLKRNGDAIGRDLQLATLVNFTTRSIRESKLPTLPYLTDRHLTDHSTLRNRKSREIR